MLLLGLYVLSTTCVDLGGSYNLKLGVIILLHILVAFGGSQLISINFSLSNSIFVCILFLGYLLIKSPYCLYFIFLHMGLDNVN